MIFLTYLKAKVQLIFWLMTGGTIMTYFVCDSCLQSFQRYFTVSAFTASIWISMWLGNEYLSHWLDEKILWTKEPGKRFMAGVAAMLAYTIAMTYLLIVVFQYILDLNIGDLNEMLLGTITVTAAITLFMTSRSFLFNWRQSAVNAEKLHRENMSARYESLKSQVNPHFLFNSLNALTSLVYENPDKAVKFIKQLSDVYRYLLETREKELVPLVDELEFLDSYLAMQQIRYGDKLVVINELKGLETYVAPLALQMLIENSIKHNVISQESPLRIRLFSHGVNLIVENNLQKKKTLDGDSPGVGLDNIQRRYEFISNKKVEVINENGVFQVRLPLIQKPQ